MVYLASLTRAVSLSGQDSLGCGIILYSVGIMRDAVGCLAEESMCVEVFMISISCNKLGNALYF